MVTFGHIRGIPVVAGMPFVAGCVLMGTAVQHFFENRVPVDDPTSLTILVVLLFAASILLHEVGHALSAARDGAEGVVIHLGFLGGAAMALRSSTAPDSEFRFAIAGPAVTALIIVACEVVGQLAGWSWADGSSQLLARTPTAAADGALQILLMSNVIILAYNMVPALPLDGGAALEAAVWRGTGSRETGRVTIGVIGLGIAAALVLWGLPDVGGGQDHLLAVITGGYLASVALGALRKPPAETEPVARLSEALAPGQVTAASHMPVVLAWRVLFEPHPERWFVPVIGPGGHYVGAAHRTPVADAAAAGVGVDMAQVVSNPRADDLIDLVAPWAPIDHAAAAPALGQGGAVVAVDADRRYVGVASATAIQRALAARDG